GALRKPADAPSPRSLQLRHGTPLLTICRLPKSPSRVCPCSPVPGASRLTGNDQRSRQPTTCDSKAPPWPRPPLLEETQDMPPWQLKPPPQLQLLIFLTSIYH